jgi:hypothetical protein
MTKHFDNSRSGYTSSNHLATDSKLKNARERSVGAHNSKVNITTLASSLNCCGRKGL